MCLRAVRGSPSTRPARFSDHLTMNILAVDTCLGACSVAVVASDKVLATCFERMERGHAEALAPMVEKAITEAGISFVALDRLGVTTGPGTFTGQRVGLAFMRGLRLALGRPLIGVTSLEAMSCQATEETGVALAAAIHDARGDEVYFQLCARGLPLTPPLKLSLAAAAERIAEAGDTVVLAGMASERLLEAGLVDPRRAILSRVVLPDARWVARLVRSRPPPSEIPKPLYLHPPAATIPGSVK